MGEDLMAVTYVGSATAGVNGIFWAQPLPSGIQTGDYMVMLVQTRGTASTTVGTPTGWTRLVDQPRGTAGRMLIFCAPHGVAEPTFTSNASGTHLSAVLAFRGVNLANPIFDHAYNQGSQAGTSNHPVPGLTHAPEGSMIMRTAGATGATGISWTWPGPDVERVDYAGGFAATITAATREWPTAGAVPSTTANMSSSTISYGTTTIALNPATSRLHLGSTPVPLMLGNTEVEVMGP
ncbi:hypothetical protein [Rhodococcus sp. BE178]|uniref:hypothetical protein n=1 Tax=Rhodococcus sp. BE178 TaxID=2817737 RepID=UPI003D1E4DF1